MFGISKKKIIENYENQLKWRNERTRSLVKENKKLKQDNIALSQSCKMLNEIVEESKSEMLKLSNAKIYRLENLKIKTKKVKVKKKCENRILEIEKRYL